MKLRLTLALALCSILSSNAQTYFVNQIPYQPMPFDSGIDVVTYVDDTWSSPIPIGFDFYFFDQPYQSLLLGTNGIVSFDLSNATLYCQWPINNAIPSIDNPMNSIMFPFQDLDPSQGGTIHHQVYGIPPYRKFVLSFNTVPYYQCNDSTFTGQLILYETTSNIEMQTHQKIICPTWNNMAAILGIQNAAGTEAYWAPDHNFPSVWNASDEAWLFSPDSNYISNLDRISGRVFADLDHDCNFNSADYGLMNKPVILTDTSSNAIFTFTDMLGYYSKLVSPGEYSVTTQNIANQYYSSNCPSGGSYTVTFTGYNDSSDNNLFADTIVNFCADLQVSLWAYGEPDSASIFGPLGVCDTGYISITCMNNGSIGDEATVVLTMNDSTSILYSTVAFSVLGNNQYGFSFGQMQPGGDSSVTIMIQDGCDTIGTLYCFNATVSGTQFDCQTYNNADQFCAEIGVPFDPNAMYVSSSILSTAFTDYLLTQPTDDPEYTITFQNTGTATAHDVIIKTIIDEHLDPTTISPGFSSHPYNWLVLNDTLIFVFNQIELPDSGNNEAGSHGFISFRIQQTNNSTPGTIIPAQAAIYFDYLNPVITNTAIVEIENPESGSTISNNSLHSLVFPNPAHDQFYLTVAGMGSFSVFNIYGKLMEQDTLNQFAVIDASDWQNGLYFISVCTKSGTELLKMIKN